MEDKKNILVTGGAGYIGSHTVLALLQHGFNPVIVDDFRNADSSVIERLKEISGTNIQFSAVDCCDINVLRKIFEQQSIYGIIHFAAYKAVGESVEKPLMYYQNNLVSLMNVLQLAAEKNVKNIVFSSSCTVYGEPEDTSEVDENTPLQIPSSPYGQTKFMSEQILKDFQLANSSHKIFALRYFNPVGAHSSAIIGEFPIGIPNNLVPFITQTAAGIQEQLTVFGNDYPTEDGTCIRDFIHVEDLGDAHVAAITKAIASEGFFDAVNLGTGKGTSVHELITIFEKVSGKKLNYTFGNRRPGDIVSIYANAQKAKQILKWESKKTIEEAMLSAWKWQQTLLK
ncbi:MAG: UDP-glucose 4-epimerase GalE [Flavobacteriales bacterium]|jgi:UDP-glucose 4-epimerase